MKTKYLCIVIVATVLVGLAVADTRIHRRDESAANTKNWLKGILSSIFGSKEQTAPTTTGNESLSNATASTNSGNETKNLNETENGVQNAANNSTGNTTTPAGQAATNSETSATSTTLPPQSSAPNTTASSNAVTNSGTPSTASSVPSATGATTGAPNPPASSSSGSSNPNTSQPNKETIECNSSRPIGLDRFCILPEQFQVYLNGNKTVDTVYANLFSHDIINRLVDQCPTAQWCLPEEQTSLFSDKMADFYKGPLCDDGFVQCLSLIAEHYKECPVRKRLMFLANTLSLLCGMKMLKPELSAVCFSETLSNLHLTIATTIHIERNPELDTDYSITNYCNSPKSKMTKQYLCNLERCPNLQIMLSSFYPWAWFLQSQPSPLDVCKFPQVCDDVTKTTTTESWKPPTLSTATTTTLSSESGETSTPQDGQHTFFYVVTGDDSTSLLVGVATGTAVALVGMTILICACHKRARRANGAVYRSGYKKLNNDEDP